MLRRFGLLTLSTLAVPLLAACSVLRIGPAAEILNLEEQTDAEKNMEAVRAMQREWQRRSGEPDFPRASRSSSAKEDVTSQAGAHSLLSFSVPAAPIEETKTIIQWTPPSIPRPGPPDRSVPAYTIPAPVGPGEPGVSRCVPDGLGGQRCLRP